MRRGRAAWRQGDLFAVHFYFHARDAVRIGFLFHGRETEDAEMAEIHAQQHGLQVRRQEIQESLPFLLIARVAFYDKILFPFFTQ